MLLPFAIALSLAAATPQTTGWSYAAKQREDKHLHHVVTGTPVPDPKSFLRTGSVSLRCTDKDPALEAVYVSGTPGDGAPLALAFDAGDVVLYDADWYTNLSARLPAARLLAALEPAHALTIAVAGSPEHYDLRSLAPALAELRKHCQFPAPPASHVGAATATGRWTARALVTAKGEEGAVFSLKGDNGVASLRLRCKGGDADVYLAVDSGGLSSRNQPVGLQLDDGPTLKATGSAGSDGKALYLAKPRDQLRSLSGHARLNVAFAGPLGAPAVDSFDLSGVDETLAPWAGACGIRK